MTNYAFNANNAGNDGFLTITVTQLSQDWVANTSQVRVKGTIKQNSGHRVIANNVTRHISGDGSWNPDKFDINLGDNVPLDYIQHEFTVTHGSDGYAHVNYTVDFGDTGTSEFGNGSSSSVGLELTRIPKKPDKPTNLRITAQGPTTLSLAWDAPGDDHGSAIIDYDLITHRTFDFSDTPTHNHGDSRTRNLTHLDAGGKYWFTVTAINSAGDNGGVSNQSDTVFAGMQPGFWVRVNGEWTTADVYVRSGGVWKLATPYVRTGQTVDGVGIWSTTI
jgi:hypothetical protein